MHLQAALARGHPCKTRVFSPILSVFACSVGPQVHPHQRGAAFCNVSLARVAAGQGWLQVHVPSPSDRTARPLRTKPARNPKGAPPAPRSRDTSARSGIKRVVWNGWLKLPRLHSVFHSAARASRQNTASSPLSASWAEVGSGREKTSEVAVLASPKKVTGLTLPKKAGLALPLMKVGKTRGDLLLASRRTVSFFGWMLLRSGGEMLLRYEVLLRGGGMLLMTDLACRRSVVEHVQCTTPPVGCAAGPERPRCAT